MVKTRCPDERAPDWGQGQVLRVSVLVGGFVHQALRQSIEAEETSRVDVLEMEARFGWPVLDFSWLESRERAHRSLRIIGTIVRRTFGWSCWLAINAGWTARNDDAVYCTGEDVSLPAGLLRRLTRRRTPRLVARIEQVSKGSTRRKQWMYEHLFRLAYGGHDRLLCRTRAQIDELARLGLATGKATFVPEPTDTSFFSPFPHSQPAEITACVPRDRYILSAGLELRDYGTLIEATNGMDIRLVIAAGSPWSKFGASLAREYDPAKVTVAAFSRLQLRELYRSAALVVVPVHQTARACGMNVVLEAWATRRPVIASETAGLRSYIDDEQTGYFVAPEDSIGLRSRIQEVLADTAAAQAMAERGHARAIRCHSVDQFVERVYETIDETITSVYVRASH